MHLVCTISQGYRNNWKTHKCIASLSGAFGGESTTQCFVLWNDHCDIRLGLLATAILKMDGIGGLAGWRWIFILEGIATFLIGCSSAIFLPADIPSAKFLNAEELEFACELMSSHPWRHHESWIRVQCVVSELGTPPLRKSHYPKPPKESVVRRTMWNMSKFPVSGGWARKSWTRRMSSLSGGKSSEVCDNNLVMTVLEFLLDGWKAAWTFNAGWLELRILDSSWACIATPSSCRQS